MREGLSSALARREASFSAPVARHLEVEIIRGSDEPHAEELVRDDVQSVRGMRHVNDHSGGELCNKQRKEPLPNSGKLAARVEREQEDAAHHKGLGEH